MSAKFIWLLLLVLDIFIGVPGQDFPCTNGAGQSGTCSTVKYCPTAAQLFASLPLTKLLSDDCFVDIHGDVHICCIPDINSTKDPVPISTTARPISVGSSITRQDCGAVINYTDPSPWFVALGQRKGNIFITRCEGVLVSPTKVLSRATCSSRITHARIGVTLIEDITGQDKLVVNFFKLQHQEAYSNNLGVFTLINPVKYNDRVQPICVPGAIASVGAFTIPVWQKQKNTQNGRGYSSTFVAPCNRDLGGNLNYTCTMYINCDSEIIGLPILTSKNPNDGKYYVVGMGSYNPNAQCDTIATYVFTRVAAYKKWIEKL